MNHIVFANNYIKNATIISYPDGQKSVCLNLDKLNVKEAVSIECRIKNWSDMEVLMCLCAALHKNDFAIQYIDFRYLFGMRSDRAFNPGEPNYMRDVLAPVIKSLGSSSIGILQAHSDIAANYCGGFSSSMLRKLVTTTPIDSLLIAGDQSIHWKEKFQFERREHTYFIKKRNPDRIDIYLPPEGIALAKSLPILQPIIIYDDLCDGGATFIAEAIYLREKLEVKNPLHLIVTHGLFSNGLETMWKYFSKIITTNSYYDYINLPNLEVLNVYEN